MTSSELNRMYPASGVYTPPGILKLLPQDFSNIGKGKMIDHAVFARISFMSLYFGELFWEW